jgi:hypothetical protein
MAAKQLPSGRQTNNARADNHDAIGRVQTILPKVTVRSGESASPDAFNPFGATPERLRTRDGRQRKPHCGFLPADEYPFPFCYMADRFDQSHKKRG